MDEALLTLLRSVDTPTVCNAIETAEGKRGFNAFTRGTVMASAPDHRAMVGYARTARISALAPSPDPADVVRERRLGYYRHMSEGPRPAVPWSRMWTARMRSAPIGARSTPMFTSRSASTAR